MKWRLHRHASAILFCASIVFCAAASAQTDPLPSWNDGAAKKAIVIFADASGQIMKVDATTKTVIRPGNTTGLFAAATDWLDATNNPVMNPQ